MANLNFWKYLLAKSASKFITCKSNVHGSELYTIVHNIEHIIRVIVHNNNTLASETFPPRTYLFIACYSYSSVLRSVSWKDKVKL